MSFAAKPFSALQRAPEQRANGPPLLPPWRRHQRRDFNEGRGSRSVGSSGTGGGARLSGWSGDCALQRRIQPEMTFECWCAPPERRRLVRSAADGRRTAEASPTEAVLAIVALPPAEFGCPGPPIEVTAEVVDTDPLLYEPPQLPHSLPSLPGTPPAAGEQTRGIKLANFEDSFPKLQPPPKPMRPQSVSTKQLQHRHLNQQQQPTHQHPKLRSQSPPPSRPQLEHQRVRPSRPQSAGPNEIFEMTGSREQLLRLARLSYTHSTQSDLATRRLLRSSLLHRSLEPVGGNSGGGVSRTIGTGFLTRQRLPVSTEQEESQSNRMWQRSQCFILPPIAPD